LQALQQDSIRDLRTNPQDLEMLHRVPLGLELPLIHHLIQPINQQIPNSKGVYGQ